MNIFASPEISVTIKIAINSVSKCVTSWSKPHKFKVEDGGIYTKQTILCKVQFTITETPTEVMSFDGNIQLYKECFLNVMLSLSGSNVVFLAGLPLNII